VRDYPSLSLFSKGLNMENGILNYNAERFPCPFSPTGGMILLSILKKSIDGYRVYSAIVDDISRIDPGYGQYLEWVAAHGNKRSYRDASKLFYGFSEDEYAR
jgi:hypothetical protein